MVKVGTEGGVGEGSRGSRNVCNLRLAAPPSSKLQLPVANRPAKHHTHPMLVPQVVPSQPLSCCSRMPYCGVGVGEERLMTKTHLK